jgi:hypothetical protein
VFASADSEAGSGDTSESAQAFAPHQAVVSPAVIPGGIWFTPTNAQVALLVAAQVATSLPTILEFASTFEAHLWEMNQRNAERGS